MADRLDEIRERCKAFEKFYADDIKASRPSLAWKRDVEERKFVEHARVDLPWTLDRIDRLERALKVADSTFGTILMAAPRGHPDPEYYLGVVESGRWEIKEIMKEKPSDDHHG